MGEQRKLIEESFHNNVIRVICATSTLAAGVNLPAHRVIFRSFSGWPTGGGSTSTWGPLRVNDYRQMAGRAGRAGLAKHGESVLLVGSEAEREQAERLLASPTEPMLSCLRVDQPEVARRFALELVTAKLATNPITMERCVRSGAARASGQKTAGSSLRVPIEHAQVRSLFWPSRYSSRSASRGRARQVSGALTRYDPLAAVESAAGATTL